MTPFVRTSFLHGIRLSPTLFCYLPSLENHCRCTSGSKCNKIQKNNFIIRTGHIKKRINFSNWGKRWIIGCQVQEMHCLLSMDKTKGKSLLRLPQTDGQGTICNTLCLYFCSVYIINWFSSILKFLGWIPHMTVKISGFPTWGQRKGPEFPLCQSV